jgi:hypothetical protein
MSSAILHPPEAARDSLAGDGGAAARLGRMGGLTGLRGLAALWVIGFHAQNDRPGQFLVDRLLVQSWGAARTA